MLKLNRLTQSVTFLTSVGHDKSNSARTAMTWKKLRPMDTHALLPRACANRHASATTATTASTSAATTPTVVAKDVEGHSRHLLDER